MGKYGHSEQLPSPGTAITTANAYAYVTFVNSGFEDLEIFIRETGAANAAKIKIDLSPDKKADPASGTDYWVSEVAEQVLNASGNVRLNPDPLAAKYRIGYKSSVGGAHAQIEVFFVARIAG